MLIGSYLGLLGEKRRTAVPKRFLDELGEKLVVAKWYDGCLVLVSEGFWEALLNRLTGGSRVASLGVRDIERFILGSAFEVTPDNQGRIIIPEILAGFAGLENELVFLGLGDRVEIWGRKIWEERAGKIAETTRDYIENLAKDGK
ncbi:hypothetical protein A3E15_02940 [Candidatus Woesebacteria bacterium RIFCSPHIGHO2_12_FULL_42_9]|uniref:Transcriptional regulator MraZ n=2 Tax=Candidatus Woeseibacteriota TaxID=1752722 RepID=A0A1F8AWS3_9BACT|nr:MAG: hypothetical protein A2129_02375 [Candidatus Woesebacteria bacterium GWC1_42_13]OGM55695.1 MAG: hypothetical protein A3E15_02940 [Candidatus Woesebacteria bacterium RIFCSPHIGHO2_12_FULL_42_9]